LAVAIVATAAEPSPTGARTSSVNRWPDDGSPLAAAARARASKLAAGHAHMAGERGPLVAPVDDEIVPLGFARYCLFDRRVEQTVAFGRAQRGAQVGGVFLA